MIQEFLSQIRFRDLRHTAATLLLLQETHPKMVQERLGHSQVSLTLDTYSRVAFHAKGSGTNVGPNVCDEGMRGRFERN
jgi:integrase